MELGSLDASIPRLRYNAAMQTFFEKISVLCFAASYAAAFALEFWHLLRPRPIFRVVALGFAAAGLFAHVAFLIVQCFVVANPLPLGSPTGSLFFLALILAVFYVGEAIHHGRIAWALFVLPVVLGLIGLGWFLHDPTAPADWQSVWGVAHYVLLLLAAVGVSIGFIASVMYLVQLGRLRNKLSPGHGLPLFSLERLEQMNRRALLAAFPLLTAGLLIGIVLQFTGGEQDWLSLRILSVVCLWVVFTILLYLRYFVHARGRQLAIWTLFAFAILVVALVSAPHTHGSGGAP